MIKIDFDNTYDKDEVAEDLSYLIFRTIDVDGNAIPIKVQFRFVTIPLLPGVYNLAFGPMRSDTNGDDEIDDIAKIKHKDIGKVFYHFIVCIGFFERES